MSSLKRPLRKLSRRLRIRTRLGLAFGLLLLLLMGLAALSVYRLAGLSEALNRIVDDQAVIRDSVNEINRNAEAVARKLLVLMSPDAELRVSAYPEISSANNRLDDAMQRLAMVLPSGPRTERLAEVRMRLADYRASYVDVRNLIERDDFQAARALLGSDTESALSLFVSAIHQLAASEERAGTAQARELRDQIDVDRTGVLALCIGALVAGALLAVGVTRSIVIPLKRAAAGQFARAREARRADLHRRRPAQGRQRGAGLRRRRRTAARRGRQAGRLVRGGGRLRPPGWRHLCGPGARAAPGAWHGARHPVARGGRAQAELAGAVAGPVGVPRRARASCNWRSPRPA
jgi:hypothetical protein